MASYSPVLLLGKKGPKSIVSGGPTQAGQKNSHCQGEKTEYRGQWLSQSEFLVGSLEFCERILGDARCGVW